MPIDVTRVQAQVGQRTLTLETGKLAKQADGAVLVTYGESVALVTAVASPTVREGIDFFPLTIDVEERMYAAGKIPGGFFRREGRAQERGILTCRLVDRGIRPLFPDAFRHGVQVIATIMQVDQENPWDVHCITAASAALRLGGIPIAGPLSGLRLAHVRGSWVVYPSFQELENATIELVVAGKVTGDDVDILMVEAGGFEHTIRLIRQEGAPPPTEEIIAEGFEKAKQLIRQLDTLQRQLVAQVQVPERVWIRAVDYEQDVWEWVVAQAEDELARAYQIPGKQERRDAEAQARERLLSNLPAHLAERDKEVSTAFRSLAKKVVRRRILEEGKRVDGRGPTDIRPLHVEVGVLSRVHGTGLFQRGETQALSATTLGMPRMEQIIDQIWPDQSKRYMHHYVFPPFSVGEERPLRGPSRRDIGHGALAEKAVLPVVPSEDEFPYAIRVVSEILESNGSTSMAATCGSTLALMDAGVPLKDMVGGIAMGLVAGDGRYVTLTDIVGDEDFYGDMDFKVAGTRDFVTALQLDTKTTGIPAHVLAAALLQARDARMVILDAMRAVIPTPRASVSPFAPRIIIEQIPVDKIGEVIGPKGKTINDIVARCEVQIDIEDDGRVFIAATDGEKAERALVLIRSIAKPTPLEVGQEFEGTVVKTTDFGAFVQLLPGKDGLVHISKLGRGQRIKRVEDVVSVGARLWVRIAEIRPDGKLSLVPIDGPSQGGEPEPARVGAEDFATP